MSQPSLHEPAGISAAADDAEQAASLLALADQVLAPTYRRPERLFVSGAGAWLVDAEGRSYLDMTSGVAVVALGHASPIVAGALRDALARPVHTSNLFHTGPAIRLASRLVAGCFADRVFFCNSGAEAVEGAFKFARRFGGARRRIVAFRGSFHGRTMGALAATDRPGASEPFAPLAGDVEIVPWNDDAALAAIDDSVAAAIVEPIQGEGGVRPADPTWLKALRRRCDEVGALLIFDEIQCGLGRSGELWAHQAYGVQPDLMTAAKPLGGGLPIGAVLLSERVAAAIQPGDHATTFGGGPLVCTVAHAVVETIDQPEFLADVQRRGALLSRGLRELESPLLLDVRGPGLMIGARVAAETSRVVAAALDCGLLLVPAGDGVVRFLPPLVIEDEELREAVHRFGRALGQVEEGQ